MLISIRYRESPVTILQRGATVVRPAFLFLSALDGTIRASVDVPLKVSGKPRSNSRPGEANDSRALCISSVTRSRILRAVSPSSPSKQSYNSFLRYRASAASFWVSLSPRAVRWISFALPSVVEAFLRSRPRFSRRVTIAVMVLASANIASPRSACLIPGSR